MTLQNKNIKSLIAHAKVRVMRQVIHYACNFEDVNLFAHSKVIHGHDRFYE